MEPELYFKEKIDNLESRVKIIEWAFYFFVFTVFGVAIFLNLMLTATVPEFKKLFLEILAGEPLPVLTEWALSYSHLALFFDVIFALVLIALCALGKFKYFLPLGIIFTICLFVKISFLSSSLMLPLVYIVRKLGGG